MKIIKSIQIVIDSIEEIPNNEKSALEVVDNIESNDIPICRICMEPQLEDSDSIMSLGCGCRHGLGQAHKNCLIKWFCQRRYVSIFNFNGLPGYKKCEICKKILSPSIRGLINVHWRTYFEEEMEKIIILQGNERRSAREVRMTWKDIAYFILAIIFITIFVGFCRAFFIYFTE